MARPIAIERNKRNWVACPHCDGIGGPVTIHGVSHRFDREYDADGFVRYRWVCSCGSKGQWSVGSMGVPYHSWLKHLDRARMRR